MKLKDLTIGSLLQKRHTNPIPNSSNPFAQFYWVSDSYTRKEDRVHVIELISVEDIGPKSRYFNTLRFCNMKLMEDFSVVRIRQIDEDTPVANKQVWKHAIPFLNQEARTNIHGNTEWHWVYQNGIYESVINTEQLLASYLPPEQR